MVLKKAAASTLLTHRFAAPIVSANFCNFVFQLHFPRTSRAVFGGLFVLTWKLHPCLSKMRPFLKISRPPDCKSTALGYVGSNISKHDFSYPTNTAVSPRSSPQRTFNISFLRRGAGKTANSQGRLFLPSYQILTRIYFW